MWRNQQLHWIVFVDEGSEWVVAAFDRTPFHMVCNQHWLWTSSWTLGTSGACPLAVSNLISQPLRVSSAGQKDASDETDVDEGTSLTKELAILIDMVTDVEAVLAAGLFDGSEWEVVGRSSLGSSRGAVVDLESGVEED